MYLVLTEYFMVLGVELTLVKRKNLELVFEIGITWTVLNTLWNELWTNCITALFKYVYLTYVGSVEAISNKKIMLSMNTLFSYKI